MEKDILYKMFLEGVTEVFVHFYLFSGLKFTLLENIQNIILLTNSENEIFKIYWQVLILITHKHNMIDCGL